MTDTPVSLLTAKTRIRTHDRMSFKRCRVFWEYTSPNRYNYTPIRPSIPLVFGTALHKGLEVLYNPETASDPREFVVQESLAAFVNSLREGMGEYFTEDNKLEHESLGREMIQHYVRWIATADLDWEVVFTEVPFSIPIPLTQVGASEYSNISYYTDPGSDTHYLAERVSIEGLGTVTVPVRYEGQLDLVVRHKRTGRVIIWDTKSTARLDVDGYGWLELDQQINAYYWAARNVLNIDVSGVGFNILKKSAPDEPELVYKGKALSKAKHQSTTKELYNKAIERYGFDPNDYAEFLASYEEPTYFHREEVIKFDTDLRMIEKFIAWEAMDIINKETKIYPNPNELNCKYCAFQAPCKIRHSGQDDIRWIDTSGLYVKNTSYGAPVV
ncbi:MAG: PD-(D/E)XK nuclease family protein [Chitinophagaceae bacterium]